MPEYSGTENLEIMTEAVNYNRFLLSLVRREIQPDDLVVDFGAGIGTFAAALAAEGHRVCCVEPDNAQRARILAAGLAASPDLKSFAEGSVDLLYTLNVLEHIEDELAVLRSCHQIIKPGGRILIYVPAFQILYSAMDEKVGHLRRYTRSTLVAKVRAAGFRVLSSGYADSAGFPASLLFKVCGDPGGTVNRRALVAYDRWLFPLSRLADRLFSGLFGKNVWLIADRTKL